MNITQMKSSKKLLYKIEVDGPDHIFAWIIDVIPNQESDMKPIVLKEFFNKYPQYKDKKVDVYFIKEMENENK